MEALLARGEYSGLTLAFQGFVRLLAEGDQTPGQLAERLGLSKQAVNQTLRQLERLGLVARRANPADGRSRFVSLSPRGRRLVADGIAVTRALREAWAAAAGEALLRAFEADLEALTLALGVEVPAVAVGPRPLELCLPPLADHCYRWLVASLAEKGFPGLKPAYSQVLGLVGDQGARIGEIVALTGVSRQAVAALAAELAAAGYLEREADPEDARRLVLRLAPRGRELLAAAADSVAALEARFARLLGEARAGAFRERLARLFAAVTWELGERDARLESLARELAGRLGAPAARRLGELLLKTVGGDL
ncbi:MAG: hypothetical protein KatS3mg124_1969 [Porticoccaceae bacterium]|nr:MAG: hypothetical protein KatS3mg124_1969 [Porticoccaceae bacterium]